MKLNEVFATNLRVIMARDNVSVQDLHEETGISKTTIITYRKGRNKAVNLIVVDKLADALGVNASELFTRNHNTHKLEDWIKTVNV
ncbi:TPA: helix-turn-helix transcriptional regulator [Staphylococcus aureus]|uniref:ORF061 n=1 Tax=Staphylococcus phage 187 TaxID=2908096 RepID=Q4ZDX6_9CAUD|nr:ORF061 [Staphylococcus phage 187]MBO8775039.1 helix-turn-helix transcriptional regulator [Staphylococcus aureus]AAX90728.1 ORF061 [Staphylococcus phage 187]MCD0517331.1 helix-turn-helix transcriptional regulator [Staphylococcus aureus]NFY06602.1 helix-turn-helix transcriptional regulator [Staphylococcus aureus]NGL39956.1 helix-turn-helix transcriptional regulator [Staphylococcus aureus]